MESPLAGHHGALADPNCPRPSVNIARAVAEAADGDEHLALAIQLSLDHAQPQGMAPAFGGGLAPRAAGEDSPHHAHAAEQPEPAPAAEPPALSVGQLAGMWGRDASRAGAPRFKLTDLRTKRETEVPHTGIADAFTIGRGSIFDIDLHSDGPTPAGGDLLAIIYSLASGSYVFAIDHTSAHLDTRTLPPVPGASTLPDLRRGLGGKSSCGLRLQPGNVLHVGGSRLRVDSLGQGIGSGPRTDRKRKRDHQGESSTRAEAGRARAQRQRAGRRERDQHAAQVHADRQHAQRSHIAPGLPSSGD